MNRAELRNLLEPLLRLPTAPYHEDAISDHLRRVLAGRQLAISIDPFGNLLVRRPAARPTHARLGFMAHMDHPGFEVIEHTPNGIRTAWHGGVQQEYFVGAKVRFYVRGQIHRGEIESFTVDEQTGRIATADVVCETRPPAGALGMWDLPEAEFNNGAIRAPAIDDVAGCGILLATLVDLTDRPLDAEIWILFTRAEEVGFIGAIGMARAGRLPPSMPVISVEMSRSVAGATQGLGPVIRLGDRSSVFDQGTLLFMKDVAADLKTRAEGFKYQQALMDGGSCEATALSAFGYRTGGLAVPLGNYHNQKPAGPNGPWSLEPEEINFSDLHNAVEFCVAMCDAFPGLDLVRNQHRAKLVERTAARVYRLEYQQHLKYRAG